MDLSSPFVSVLHTNYVPSAAENSQVKTLVIDRCSQLLKLNSEIDDLQRTLDRLVVERDAVDSTIVSHRALISPLRRLPPETLGDIFLHCLPDNGFAVRSVAKAPLLLTRICRGWREVALSTPLLWAGLHISISSLATQLQFDERLEGIKMWLDRSRSLPLSLSLDIVDSGITSPEHLVSFYASLSHRWREIQLNVSVEILNQFARLVGYDVPLLEKLLIKPWVRWGVPDFELSAMNKMIAEAPNLRKVSFFHLKEMYSALPVAWHNLIELTLGRAARLSATLTISEALSILMQAPMLHYCNLVTDGTGPHALAQARLPFLHTLLVYFSSGTGAKVLFDNLLVPVLVNLAVTAYSWPSALDQAPFVFLPLYQLQTLTTNVPFSPNGMVECLRQMSSLRCLDITSLDKDLSAGTSTSESFSDFHLNLLRPINGSRTTLCPLLQDLTLINCDSVSDEGLLLYLQSKLSSAEVLDTSLHQSTSSQLRSLKSIFKRKMSLSRDIFEAHVAPLELEKRGICLRVSYPEVSTESPYQGLHDDAETIFVGPLYFPPIRQSKGAGFVLDTYRKFWV